VSASALAVAALTFVAAALAALGVAMLVPERAHRREGTGLLRLLAVAGRRLRPTGGAAPRELSALVAAAGSPGGLGPRELMAGKLAAAVTCGAGGLPIAAAAPGRLGPLLAAAAPVAGFLAPDLWLARRAAERARRVTRELPAMLDLLRVGIEAGVSLPATLRDVGERTAGPLAAEWRAVGREVALGVPLSFALREMLVHLPQPEVQALVAALERAGRHGTPLAETLAGQARDARFALHRRVREEAARAGPKIQLVVALLLVPSVLLLVAAALVSALLGSGGQFLPIG
jgi:tight adherence protein C